MKEGRDIWLKEAMEAERPYCPCEVMDSEDVLFLLYTSGSTGKPKGVVHTCAGYLTYTMATHRFVMDVQPGDVYACVADVGWITGHSYIVYGPLANGATTLMFESIPTYPDAGRYWDMVERHKITQFYTAPTALRALSSYGDDFVTKYDRSSLKVLGTVGEPINPEVWEWYYHVIGNGECPIVDTYWQTETGGFVLTPFPGATDLKPGSATKPFFGIEPVLLDKDSGKEILQGEHEVVEGLLALKRPWPSTIRTVYGDHQRMLNTYMNSAPGYYLTGDGAKRDQDGYYWVTGRVDDVMNVSGHRIGTAEIESVLIEHKDVASAAVVGQQHPIKGQAPFAYITLNQGANTSDSLAGELNKFVAEKIGPIYKVEQFIVVEQVPTTRSGKIMRRILRKIADGEYDRLGDITTLKNPEAVEQAITRVKETNA
jgi:acetyl-CoA synthetase